MQSLTPEELDKNLIKSFEDKKDLESYKYLESFIGNIELFFDKIIVHLGENKMIYSKQKSVLINLNEVRFDVQKSDLEKKLLLKFNLSEIICGGVITSILNDFLNKNANLKFATTILNLFDINESIDFNEAIQKKT